jgi:hypothetical protein
VILVSKPDGTMRERYQAIMDAKTMHPAIDMGKR